MNEFIKRYLKESSMFKANGFEITIDDVLFVVHKMGKKVTGDQANEIFENLDHFKVEEASMFGDELEQQTFYAYEEIERQIREKS